MDSSEICTLICKHFNWAPTDIAKKARGKSKQVISAKENLIKSNKFVL